MCKQSAMFGPTCASKYVTLHRNLMLKTRLAAVDHGYAHIKLTKQIKSDTLAFVLANLTR